MTVVRQRRSTPCARCKAAIRSAITPPSTPTSGAGPSSARVTGTPSSRQEEAISEPVKPPPITRTRRAGPPGAAEAVGIGARAQGEDPVERRLGRVGPGAGAGTGGDQDAVEFDALPVGEVDPFCAQVQSSRGDAQAPVDPRDGLPARERSVLSGKPAGQDAFRERRAIVWQIGFVPDDGEGADEALGAQGLRRGEPGEGGPDDHDAPVGLEKSVRKSSLRMWLPVPRVVAGDKAMEMA